MSDISIDAPYTVAILPKPFDREHGRIHNSPVRSLNGSRKRKRHEMAVAVDGEVVNIYNIQAQSLTTSYALPPQTYLCCPPCSLFQKATSTCSAQRQTYSVVKEHPNSLKRRLLCYTEEVRSKRRESDFAAPIKSQCNLQDGDIMGLDIIHTAGSDSNSVLVNYANGDIQLATKDLSNTRYEPRSNVADPSDYQVEYATVVDFDSATKGILKGRQDVVAQLQSSVVSPAGPNLLCRVARRGRHRWLELYVLRDPLSSDLQTSNRVLHLIMESELPFADKHIAMLPQYELHASTGALYQLLNGKLGVIDLSGTVPKLVTRVGSKPKPIGSFCRVSSTSVLAFANNQATLLETSFGSVQASISLSDSPSSITTSRKRKHDDEGEVISRFSAACAYGDIGLVVGITRQDLTALQLNGTTRHQRASAAMRTLLRDANSHGTMKTSGAQEKSSKKMRYWEAWVSEVDRLVDSDDMEGLENLIANDKEFGRQRKVEKALEGKDTDDVDGVDAITYADLWPLPEAFDPQDVEKRKALYLISKVFELEGDMNDKFHIRIPSFKLLELFALSGLLSTSYLQSVLEQDTGASLEAMKPGDVMTAINAIDDDFQLMHDLLSLPVALEPTDVMQALRIVVQSFDTPAQQGRPLALPAPEHERGLTNGHAEHGKADEDSDVEVESKQLEMELDFVVNALNSGLEIRSETIWEITRRLSLLPRKTVTSLMRSMMLQSEIVFFIHILRIELADGGWTSRYIEDGENSGQAGLVNSIGEEEQSSPNNQAIQIIAHLLSCAIDAIGTSGWLVGLSSSVLGTDDIIESLKAEIGAGLEGCYEAHTLRALLTELEGHAATVSKTRDLAGVDNIMEVGAEAELALLPLGSGAERLVQGLKTDKEGKKTRKAVRRDRSHKIGPYSFERIRL